MTVPEERVTFDSEGLRLEGMLHRHDGPLAAVVLHPHPQYGGDMDSHVVLALRQALAEAGATTLRFNTRGAGASEGQFDNGRGEAEDLKSAINLVLADAGDRPLVLAGYSFGALVAARVAQTDPPAALILVSPPAAFAPLPELPDALPTLIATGEFDEIAPPEKLRQAGAAERRVVVVAGTGHNWWPGVDRLYEEAQTFLSAFTADQSPPAP